MERTADADEGRRSAASLDEAPRDGLRYLLRGLKATPAVVLSHRRDVLLWNPLGRALLAWHLTGPPEPPSGLASQAGSTSAGPPGDRLNLTRMLFRDPRTRLLYPHWAHETVLEAAELRQAADSHPDDLTLTALIGELCASDDHFATLWPHTAGQTRAFGVRHFLHPTAGPLELAYESIQSPDESGVSILVFSAEPDSPSERALRELSAMAPDIR
ncbi:hypothetical protein [Streptomyces sp.]|uniref:MmyB family transcriptional regulator n=1 Tax=Streptomyces sp. TaxID=1931 RepID=UPI002F3FCCA2